MRAIRSTLVSLLVVLASTARAQTPPWSSTPFNDFGVDPAEAALLAALPPVPNLLAPLWDSTSALDLVTAALGPPDEVDGIESRWAFATLTVEVKDRNSLSVIEIKPRRTPNPAMRALDVQPGFLAPFIDAAFGPCGDALTRFGRPSHKERDNFLWSSAARGRDVAAMLACSRDRPDPTAGIGPHFASLGKVRKIRLLRAELSAQHHAAIVKSAQPTMTLPARFTQVGASKAPVVDPLSLWPTGFVPGLSVARLLEQVGLPSIAEDTRAGYRLRWGIALVAETRGGRLHGVALSASGLQNYARLGVTSPLMALLGKPVSAFAEVLGPPLVRRKAVWRWGAAGHELTLEAEVDEGLVSAIDLGWSTVPERASLPCAALLEGKPTRAPKPVEFRSGDRRLSTPQLVPFKLWFGANHRDVVDRLGTPRACAEDGSSLEFPGIIAAFGPAGLDRIEIDVDLLSAEHFAAKDPLIAVLRKGRAAIEAHLGEANAEHDAADPAEHHRFEHGTQHLVIKLGKVDPFADETLPTYYRVQAETGFDYGVITGLRLDALPSAGREAFGLDFNLVVDTVFDGPLVLLTADKPRLEKRLSGKLIDALGANWTAVTAAIGEPSNTVISGRRLFLIYDADPSRQFAFVCSGATLTCHELHLGGREAHEGIQ